MKSALLLVPAIVALSACQQPAAVTVGNAWIRLAAVPANPSAGYFTLKGGAKDATLTGVSSPAATRSEMHESMKSGAMMSMAPVTSVALPAGSQVAFAPGGTHVMLYGLKAQAGGSVPLTFTFADGKTLTAEAKVIGAGDSAPE